VTNRFHSGFTLIEVAVTMMIMAALAAIAIANYAGYVRQGQRSDAKAQLLQTAQWMERFRSENHRYDRSLAGTPTALPASLVRSPGSGVALYSIALTSVSPTAYVLTAQRTDTDACGNFIIDHLGRRAVAVSGTEFGPGTVQFQRCWDR
jgi:type IV pilus assembly protein PilE